MDEKKLEIMERASLVYMRLGIKSVTMDDLASELGISKKTIYKYFKDKKDLVRQIIEAKTEMDKAVCINAMNHSGNAIDDLMQLIEIVVEHFSNINPTVFHDLKKYHPEAWGIMEAHKREFVLSMIKGNIEKGITQGKYRSDIQPEVIANLYVASLDAIMDGRIFPWPEFKFQDVIKEFINFQIYGLVNSEGRTYLLKKIAQKNA